MALISEKVPEELDSICLGTKFVVFYGGRDLPLLKTQLIMCVRGRYSDTGDTQGLNGSQMCQVSGARWCSREKRLCLLSLYTPLSHPWLPSAWETSALMDAGEEAVALCRPSPTNAISCSILQAEGVVGDPASVCARVSALALGWDLEIKRTASTGRDCCSYVKGSVLPGSVFSGSL